MKKEIREQRDLLIKIYNKETKAFDKKMEYDFNSKEYRKYDKEFNEIRTEERKVVKKLTEMVMKDKNTDWWNAASFVDAIQYFKDNKRILNELYKFEILNKSPYSRSFYNANGITWNSKPEGSLRLSDHWNFESQGEIHCKLDNTEEYTQKILLCKYHNGYYHIIKEFN